MQNRKDMLNHYKNQRQDALVEYRQAGRDRFGMDLKDNTFTTPELEYIALELPKVLGCTDGAFLGGIQDIEPLGEHLDALFEGDPLLGKIDNEGRLADYGVEFFRGWLEGLESFLDELNAAS